MLQQRAELPVAPFHAIRISYQITQHVSDVTAFSRVNNATFACDAVGGGSLQPHQVVVVAAIEPPAPPAVRTAGEGLRYRDFLTVALMIKSDDLFPDNWIYIHDSKVQVGRVQNYRSWSPEMVPDPSIACVGLEYFCFENDNLWASSDADLIELAKGHAPEPAGAARGRELIVKPAVAYKLLIAMHMADKDRVGPIA